jgi:hypothetical protein
MSMQFTLIQRVFILETYVQKKTSASIMGNLEYGFPIFHFLEIKRIQEFKVTSYT